MAKLGSEENPLILNVHSEFNLDLATKLCEGHGWKYNIGMNRDEPENMSDLDRKMAPIAREIQKETQFPKVGRNEPCPCGSGKKFKKCCLENICPCCGELTTDTHLQDISARHDETLKAIQNLT